MPSINPALVVKAKGYQGFSASCLLEFVDMEVDEIKGPIDLDGVTKLITEGDTVGLSSLLSDIDATLIGSLFCETRLQDSLHIAYQHNAYPMMEHLLTIAPGLVDIENAYGLTVLFRAVHDYKKDVVQLLFRYGASVQKTEAALQRASCAYSPLIHTAVKTNDKDLILMIIDAGCNLNAICPMGRDCMQDAAISCSPDVLECLGARMPKKSYRFQHEEPVNLALGYNSKQACRKLMPTMTKSGYSKLCAFVFILFGDNDNEEIAVYLLQDADAEECITFYEICGAKRIKQGRCQDGIDAWREAMIERWREGEIPFPKEPLQNSVSKILGVKEIQTLADVEALPVCRTTLMTQALLVLERHLFKWSVYGEFLYSLVQIFIDVNKYQEALSLLKYSFTTVLHEESGSEGRRAVQHLTTLLEKRVEVPFGDVLPLLEQINMIIRKKLDSEVFQASREGHNVRPMDDKKCCRLCRNINTVMETFLEALALLHKLREKARPEEIKELGNSIKTFLKECPTLRCENFFHTTVLNMQTFDPEVLKLLVHGSQLLKTEGWTLEALHLRRNDRGETPLHIYARKLSKEVLIEGGIIDHFLLHDADLCMEDHCGVKVMDILLERGIMEAGPLVPRLQCLAAREVYYLPYPRTDLGMLTEIVQRHESFCGKVVRE